MGRRRIVSITPALAGQDMAAILTDFFSVVLLLALNKKYARRAVAVTLVSALEQYCRMVVAEMLARGRGPLPDYVEMPLADAGRIASLPKEVLASFAHSFQSVEAIRRMPATSGCGTWSRTIRPCSTTLPRCSPPATTLSTRPCR